MRDHLWHDRDLGARAAVIRFDAEGRAPAPDGLAMAGWGPPTDVYYTTGQSALLDGGVADRGSGGMAPAPAPRLSPDLADEPCRARAPLSRACDRPRVARRQHLRRSRRSRAAPRLPRNARAGDRRHVQRARGRLHRAAMPVLPELSCPGRGRAGRDPR